MWGQGGAHWVGGVWHSPSPVHLQGLQSVFSSSSDTKHTRQVGPLVSSSSLSQVAPKKAAVEAALLAPDVRGLHEGMAQPWTRLAVSHHPQGGIGG